MGSPGEGDPCRQAAQPICRTRGRDAALYSRLPCTRLAGNRQRRAVLDNLTHGVGLSKVAKAQCLHDSTPPRYLNDSGLASYLCYYRTAERREVDYVLEDRRGMIVGVEVKAATNPGNDDLRGLTDLADATGKRFVRGVVLYLGREVVPYGPNMHALPMDALWRIPAG